MSASNRDTSLASAKRLVIKLGSSLLAPEGSQVRQERLKALASQVAHLKKEGRQVVLVSSGAIASGMRIKKFARRPAAVEEKQALAAIGQPELMHAYSRAFAEHGITVAQVLLTKDDILTRGRYLNARRALQALLDLDAVPIVNENDTVAVDEIRMGDNDLLSAHVANLTEADALIILTDVDGLYTANPAKNSSAVRLDSVDRITPEIRRMAGLMPGSSVGSGGMETKLAAAALVTAAGHAVLVARGTDERVIERAVAGEAVGTLFLPAGRRMPSRQRWLAVGAQARGSITVDAGARDAVVKKGRSLLPRGITAVSGTFERGEAVILRDPGGAEFGRGLASYSSAELERVKGLPSASIAAALGYTRGDTAVHRNNMAIKEET